MQTKPDQLAAPEREKIRDFLKSHPVAVLATVDPTGKPYASTIYLTVDDDLGLTFTTKHETAKYKNIAHDNHIMLAVYDAASQTTLQISGRAIEVTDPEVEQQIYRGTLHAAEQTGENIVPPIAKISAGPYVGFTVTVDDIQLTTYGWGHGLASALKHNNSQHSGDPM